MNPTKDGIVLIETSVFPDKVGRYGIVKDVTPGFDNPYEVYVPGGTTSRFKAEHLRPATAEDLARAYNRHFAELEEIRRRVEELEAAVGAPAP